MGVTEIQLEKIQKYLDDDCQMHLRSSGKWKLDGGKLRVAVESAGVEVSRPLKRRATVTLEFEVDLPADTDINGGAVDAIGVCDVRGGEDGNDILATSHDAETYSIEWV